MFILNASVLNTFNQHGSHQVRDRVFLIGNLLFLLKNYGLFYLIGLSSVQRNEQQRN